MGTYTTIFEKNRYDLANLSSKSRSWFQQQARLLSRQGIQPMSLIKSEPSRNVTKIIPGSMYLYMYDPKLKETLPYWDMFPLVFPFRRTPDGFIGLNLHYLPYHARAMLLDRLSDYITNKSMNETTRIKFSWSTIEAASRLNIAKPCVHRYILSHVKSPLKLIPAGDWATALMLPVEKFMGSNKQAVWTQSMRSLT